MIALLDAAARQNVGDLIVIGGAVGVILGACRWWWKTVVLPTIRAEIAEATKELRNNGGSSMKDASDEMRKSIVGLDRRIGSLEQIEVRHSLGRGDGRSSHD
jgi:hypothetical protein